MLLPYVHFTLYLSTVPLMLKDPASTGIQSQIFPWISLYLTAQNILDFSNFQVDICFLWMELHCWGARQNGYYLYAYITEDFTPSASNVGNTSIVFHYIFHTNCFATKLYEQWIASNGLHFKLNCVWIILAVHKGIIANWHKRTAPIWFRIFQIVYRGHNTLKLASGIFYYDWFN